MVKWFIAQERDIEDAGILIAMPMLASSSCQVKPILGEEAADINPFIVAFDKGRVYYVCEEDKYNEFETKGIAVTKKNPKIVKWLIGQFLVHVGKLNKFTLEIFKQDLSKKTNLELLDIYKKFYSLYWTAYPYSEPITWALRFSFVDELKRKIEEKTKDMNKIEGYALILTTSPESSFLNEEEAELLKIVKEIKENEDLNNLFMQDISIIKEKLPQLNPKINEKIEKHTEDYCWVPYDYGSTIWTKEYFLDVISEDIKKGLDVSQRVEKLKNYSKDLKEKKKKILEELKLDKKTEELFAAVSDAGYLIDLKKAKFSISHYHMKKWFKETASRLKISERQLNFMTPEDLENAILKNSVNTKQLDERYDYCVLLMDSGKATIYYKDQAKSYFKQFQIRIDEGKTELQGLCAQPGFAKGVAKIIKGTKDINKLQQGEILVASMTGPDFVIAMRKAAAIVTDTGGITCHAAIVSRELGVPCIVGTKIATKVFKDGDILEINGSNGIVRKVGGNLTQ